ncbi:MAG: mechanosensitive ion channel protein MscS [Thiotrichales bacterium]|nr:MAG: mechanosensitive ion channel protein MscS [Thiotrichales bacterium]
MSTITQKLSAYTPHILHIATVLLIILVINFAIRQFLKVVLRKTSATKNPFDEMFVRAANAPLRVMVWIFGLEYLLRLDFVSRHIHASRNIVSIFTKVSIILLVAWFVSRLLKAAQAHFIDALKVEEKDTKKKWRNLRLFSDSANIRTVTKLLQVIIYIVSGLLLLGAFNIPLSGLLTFGGISGAIIAFSAKDMMANFFGSVLIYFDRPFSIGDWISSPDKNIEGTVEHIGWRLTRIRGFDKRPIYVPNSLFSNIIIVNPSRMSNRRIKHQIGVRYDDANVIPGILTDIKEMLKHHVEIDQKQTTLVNLVAFADFAIEVLVYTFTKTTNWVKFQNIQDDVLLKIYAIIEKNGAECAFPTTTLHVPNEVKINVSVDAKELVKASPAKPKTKLKKV